MKNINIIFIVVILMAGCATRSDKVIVAAINPIPKNNDTLIEKYAVINDYLDSQIRDRSKKIMILSKKTNTNVTLKILRLNDIYVRDSITLNYSQDKTFYKESEWEIVRKKYSKNSIAEIENATDRAGECCWVAENFNYKNVIFEELQPGSTAFMEKYMSSKIVPIVQNVDSIAHYKLYSFSEPIYYQNRECLIFTFYKGDLLGLGGSSVIVIYKKKNGKWIQTHIGNPNWIS